MRWRAVICTLGAALVCGFFGDGVGAKELGRIEVAGWTGGAYARQSDLAQVKRISANLRQALRSM